MALAVRDIAALARGCTGRLAVFRLLFLVLVFGFLGTFLRARAESDLDFRRLEGMGVPLWKV
jgi:hypothetical protein